MRQASCGRSRVCPVRSITSRHRPSAVAPALNSARSGPRFRSANSFAACLRGFGKSVKGIACDLDVSQLRNHDRWIRA